MARAKRASDEVYNARRRAKRAIARIEREMATYTTRQATAARKYIADLQSQVAKSYSPQRGGQRGVSQAALEAAQVLRETVRTSKSRQTAATRRNEIFKREIQLASSGAPSEIAKHPDLAKGYVKIFYRATQEIWQGAPPEKRNQMIMAALGMSDLESAMARVLMNNRESVRFLRSQVRGIEDGYDTDEAWFFDEDEQEYDDGGSPDYINLVNMV